MFRFFKRSKILTFRDLIFSEDSISKSARDTLTKNKDIQDMLKDYLTSLSNHKSARIEFDNGYFISVKFGKMYYSNGIDTYEVYSNLDNNVLEYLTSEQITEYMIKIQNQ